MRLIGGGRRCITMLYIVDNPVMPRKPRQVMRQRTRTSVDADSATEPTDETAAALLLAARTLFVAEGARGLSVRRIAEMAGCTTMAVYTRYGGKDGLLGALFDEGFDRLRDAQQQARDPALLPREFIVALCRAYLETALRFPAHYALMLGQHSGEFVPSPHSVARAEAVFAVLVDAVQRWLRTQVAASDLPYQARRIALRLLALCHGWASLSVIGYLAPEAATPDELSVAVSAILDGAAA
jgi:AcrR family transcriptional regulator